MSDMETDRVALIRKRPLIVEEDLEMGSRSEFSPPPPWIDELLDVRYNATLISSKIKELDSLQGKHVGRPTFDDDKRSEEQIEELTLSITRLFGTCHRLVQVIQSKGSRSSWSEKKLRDSVVKSLVASLQELSQNFRRSQGQYLRKITAREEMSSRYFELPQLDDSSSPYNYDEIFLESESHGGSNMSSQKLLSLEEDVSMLANREKEVNGIVKSIFDLNTIFRELSTMVHEQSGIIDRIDYNVENTSIRVEEGVKKLEKAASYQKKNRKCVCIVSTIFIGFLLIILLVSFAT